MTKLLEKVFKKASKLPDTEQNTFAKWVLGELESEKKWEVMFAGSEYMLDKLADKALDEHKQGKAKTLNIAKL
jgi:NAD(P)H-flavin reductase